jgi:hypothetical protein
VPAGADPDECRKVREQLLAQLDGWRGAPFTLQRLCEVVLEPRPQYASFSKLVRRSRYRATHVAAATLASPALPPPATVD